MAKASTKTAKTVTVSSGNVFADLGFQDAGDRQTKLRLAHAINSLVESLALDQATAAAKLGVGQPKVSALANYKLEGFSVEKLMTFLTALGQDVQIVIKRKKTANVPGRISVVA